MSKHDHRRAAAIRHAGKPRARQRDGRRTAGAPCAGRRVAEDRLAVGETGPGGGGVSEGAAAGTQEQPSSTTIGVDQLAREPLDGVDTRRLYARLIGNQAAAQLDQEDLALAPSHRLNLAVRIGRQAPRTRVCSSEDPETKAGGSA